ncbi:MAG TPA: PKD domain-containing protein [Solimonas sp.]|nr:PKD domain-containing protein [Solimonas sp.]
MRSHILQLSVLSIAIAATSAAWAADPADAEINDETLSLEWTGGGPYVIPNPTGESGEPVCDPVGLLCDVFTLHVNLSDKFREMPEHQRESVRIGIGFPTDLPTVDYDLWVYDATGTVIAESSGSFGVQETASVALRTLKNGDYDVTVAPYLAMGTNYAGAIQVGKKATGDKSLSVTPQVGSAPLAVAFDARSLAGAPPAGGYVFDFGDGSAPVTDSDGVVEHTYASDGQYLGRVRLSDTSGARGVVSAAQTVFVGEIGAAKSAGQGFGGALGLGSLLAGLGLALRRGRKP